MREIIKMLEEFNNINTIDELYEFMDKIKYGYLSNIGKVYNLDSITMLDVLYRIEKLGLIKINRTAGLDVITIQEDLSFYDCVERFYASIDEKGQESTK